MSRLLMGASVIALTIAAGAPALAVVTTTGTNAISAGFPAAGAFVGIGHDDSSPAIGHLTIDGGSTAQARSVTIGSTVNSIGTARLDNGTLNLVHDNAAGFPDATLRVGENGIGTLVATNGSQVNSSNGNAFAVVGRRAGSVGTLVLDNSSFNQTSDPTNGAYATLQIARDGGTGTVVVRNGASINLTDPTGVPGSHNTSGESVFVGRSAGSTGVLSVDASTVSIQGTGAFLFIGDAGGSGTASFRNGSLLTIESTSGHVDDTASITVGRSSGGGTGALIVDQSDVTIDGGADFGGIFIGREADTTGLAEFSGNNTDIEITSDNQAGLFVGRDGRANGVLTVTDEATVELTGDDNFILVGRDSGSTGTLNVLRGGKIIATTGSDGDLTVGAAYLDGGQPAGGTGSVLIDGAGSEIAVLDNVLIGAIASFGGGIGSGIVNVRNGGQLTAEDVYVGSGGVLQGNGTINANVIVDGGIVAPGNSPGTMTIVGDFDLMMGSLIIEVTGLGAGEFDFFDVGGNIDLSGGMVEFVFSNGFAPMTGQTFDFFSGGGSINTTGTSFSFSGLEAGFAFDVADDGFGNLEFAALSDGVATTTTPAPAALAMLVSGLFGIRLVRRRR
jgi:hypothetical protein